MTATSPIQRSTERDPWLPVRYLVADRHVENHDSVTLRLTPLEPPLAPFLPGQFTMLYAPGVGEIPVSISGDPADDGLVQTIRDVGAVSHALCQTGTGTTIGVRGPFGTDWGLDTATGHDLVIVAGGLGLAPLRPVLLGALSDRPSYRGITLIAGARTPEEFLFQAQLDRWASRNDMMVEITVDIPAQGWTGGVGFVTEPLARQRLDAGNTIAFLCGPEPMMRFSAAILLRQGVPANRIRLFVERDMKCGIGLCGHCQLGPLLVCRDGPVVDYELAEPLLSVREL